MSRISRTFEQSIHTENSHLPQREPVRAHVVTTYGKYDTRFTYSINRRTTAIAVRNQMWMKLKLRPKTVAGSRRGRRIDSQEDAFGSSEEATMQHAHVSPYDDHEWHASQGGQGGQGGQGSDRRQHDDESTHSFTISRVRQTLVSIPAQRSLRDIAGTIADVAEREHVLRHMCADTLFQLGRRVDVQPDVRITPALLSYNAELLAARLESGPWTPIGWHGVKQVLLDAMCRSSRPKREIAATCNDRSSTYYLLLPLLVFNAERPSTPMQIGRAMASIKALRGGVSVT